MLRNVVLFSLLVFLSSQVQAHSGPHGNEECLLTVGKVELRLNGYQFKGSNPDRHYCRNFPHLGNTILKIDSISNDLSDMAIELQLMKRQSWKSLLLNKDDAFSVIKTVPIQYFSKQVVSISKDLQVMDIYAIKMRLQMAEGRIEEQQFMFFVGVPFVQVLVGISVFLLLLISFIFLKELKKA